MNKITLILLLSFLSFFTEINAQKSAKRSKSDEKAVKEVINTFFAAMAKGDTILLKSTCMSGMQLQSYLLNKEGKLVVKTDSAADFYKSIGSIPKGMKLDERIKFDYVHTEASLASVWTPYTFYLNDKLSHCGTNSFQLVKTEEGWKIQYIIDTRRKTGCE